MRFRPIHTLLAILVFGAAYSIYYVFFGGAYSSIFYSNSDLYCTSDSDCVKEPVCHPTRSVNREAASRYESEGICTQECKPNTLDCEQGEIRCLNNKCAAILGG